MEGTPSNSATATSGTTIDPGPPLSETRVQPATREYRAMWTFIVSVGFAVVVFALYGSIIGAVGGGVGILLGPILLVVVHAIAAIGLSGRHPAARFAMTPLLWLLIIVGVITFFASLLRSTLHVPVGAILAWWALRAEPEPRLGPVPVTSGGGTLLVAAAIVASIVGLLGSF